MNQAALNDECIFCKIIKGIIPGNTVYQDDHVLAFLDINPVAKGHTLVIPKGHYCRIADLPPEVSADLFRVVPAIAKAVQQATAAQGLNLLQSNGRCAGQVVDHVHVHVIPRYNDDGLGFRWAKAGYAQGEMDAIGQKISSKL